MRVAVLTAWHFSAWQVLVRSAVVQTGAGSLEKVPRVSLVLGKQAWKRREQLLQPGLPRAWPTLRNKAMKEQGNFHGCSNPGEDRYGGVGLASLGRQTLWRLVVEEGQDANHLRGGTDSMTGTLGPILSWGDESWRIREHHFQNGSPGPGRPCRGQLRKTGSQKIMSGSQGPFRSYGCLFWKRG